MAARREGAPTGVFRRTLSAIAFMATAAGGPQLAGSRRLAALLDVVGAEPALYSVKCFVAAMLAYYVALRIGLTHPTWAVTTSYIVAQPLAGAVLSKAVFRVSGTILGAGAAVVLVPSFVNSPPVLSLALALWLGLCLYLALLDRTPRSYVFLLAGYTASIIGFPSVEAPAQIFTLALVRVQEITLGILCGSLIHGTILPRTVTSQLLARIDRMLSDAERWSAESLGGEGGEALARDRRRLAVDVNELHQLSTHLPFDTARLRPRVRLIRALQDQVSLLLPLASGVEDRLAALARLAGRIPPDIAALSEDVRAWLLDPAGPQDEAAATALIGRAAALEPALDPPFRWEIALRLSVTARLAELIAAHRDARVLREQIRAPTARPVSPSVARLLAAARSRALHRDRGLALRAALGAVLTVALGCAIWIATAWDQGAGAVTFAGVCCALFGNSDEPAPAVMRFFWGTLLGMVVAVVYDYAILPTVTDFVTLAAVLAPAAIMVGWFSGQAKTSFVTLGAVLGLFNSLGFADRYEPDFGGFVNSSLGLLLGTFFAAVTVGLFQTIGTEGSIKRLIQAGWRDLARRSNARGVPDARGWVSRMLDRIGLLAPRLAARQADPGKPLLDVLVDMRIGLAVGELRGLRLSATPEEEALITPVLAGVARYFGSLRFPDPQPPPPELLTCIDHAFVGLVYDPAADRRRAAVLALTTLRRNLFPDAPAFTEEAA